jgi:hypothetical protein
MQTDPQQFGLTKETLQVIFGLEDSTVKRVIDVIRASQDLSDIKTYMIRSRIGSRAFRYLHNTIEYARSEGTEKHSELDLDQSKFTDLETSDRLSQQGTPTMKESFISYLIGETMIDVDLSDPNIARAEFKRAQRMAASSPERLGRENMVKAKDEQKDAIQNAQDDPNSQLKTMIAKKKMELAMLQRRLAGAMKNVQSQEGGAQI